MNCELNTIKNVGAYPCGRPNMRKQHDKCIKSPLWDLETKKSSIIK